MTEACQGKGTGRRTGRRNCVTAGNYCLCLMLITGVFFDQLLQLSRRISSCCSLYCVVDSAGKFARCVAVKPKIGFVCCTKRQPEYITLEHVIPSVLFSLTHSLTLTLIMAFLFSSSGLDCSSTAIWINMRPCFSH